MREPRLFAVAMLLFLLLPAALAAAQEAEPAAAEPALPGISTLFLLIGLGAAGLVSLIWMMRERSAEPNDDEAV